MIKVVSGADPGRVIAVARTWLGTPYHDHATNLRGVWREVVDPEPFPIPL